jgi:hypothetical protein
MSDRGIRPAIRQTLRKAISPTRPEAVGLVVVADDVGSSVERLVI